MTTRRVKDGTAKTGKRVAGSRAVTGGALVEGASWREGYNPTKRLTVERAVWLMECYSRGMFAELMWLFGAPYMGIEKKDSVYLAIIERRVAAVRQMDWSIRVDDEDADDPRAKLQKAALEDAYGKIGNLGKAVEALEMATFRGFAHLAITPDELVVVQPWNVQRDGCTGGWRFNPGAQDCGWEALGPEMDMRPEEHVTREVERPVGAVALVKWLRSNLSEKDWDAFIEVYGLPAWLIVGPPNIPEDKVDAYQTAAEKIARGGSGYLPNGSSAQCADSPRAGAPFGDRLRYLNEMLVIAGTGGMLTMLAESGSGTLAGNAHADAFATLARMDAADISECFQRQFDRRALEAAGLLAPGERAKAWFTLDFKSEPDVGETVQQIQGLSSAGYEVDPAQVAELTGYRVTRKETPAQPVPGGWGGLRLANARAVGRTAAPRPDGDGAETELAAAMQRDLKPAGKVIAEALQTRDWSEAKKRLAGILKECGTESAKVLEGVMREAGEEAAKGEGKEGLTRSRGGAEGEKALANERARGETTEGTNSGSFAPEGGGSTREQADEQSRKLGYKDRNDLLAQADQVSKERVAQLTEGGKDRCKAHEAIAVLRSNPTMKDTAGREIRFSDELIGHYVHGQRREGNTPKVGNLCDLPLAIYAVRHDRNPELKFKRGAIRDPLNPPRGTQREYKTETGNGQLHAYAYVDSGKIQGWHVK